MNLLHLDRNDDFIYTLLKIKETIPETIIAGGVLRDMYHDRAVNDIDIYVPFEKVTPATKACPISAIKKYTNVLTDDFWEDIFNIGAYEDDYISNDCGNAKEYVVKNNIGAVWEIQAAHLLYNIIVVDIDPVEYVTKFFDIGLCKIYCDGSSIRLTADFINDSRYKKLTLVSEKMKQQQFNYMMSHHIVKLKRKYPDYTLVIPDKYSEMHEKYVNNLTTP